MAYDQSSPNAQAFYLGFVLQEATREKIAKKLAFVAELSKGDFSHRIQDNCTVFVSPRQLGIEKFGRVKCYLAGVSDGLLSY